MTKSQKIFWHILLWIIVFIPISAAPVIIFILNRSTIEQATPGAHYNLDTMIWGTAIGIIKFIIVFYVAYFAIHNILKKSDLWQRKYFLIFLIFGALIIQKWVWELLPVLNTKGLSFTERFEQISTSYILLNFIVTFIQCGLAMTLRTIFAYFDEKKKRKELETTNLKNELNMLRSQVNPHFIFNTLNNIDALIKKDPQKASELLIKLSDEMRYMLYDTNIEKIDIESELKFLNNYISLQKIRINQEEPVRINIEVDNHEEKIPPMLFLPLVENAFKHGKFVNTDDAIRLALTLKNHNLYFSITNPYDTESIIDNSHKGLGLNLVKRRFDLIFPKTHKFEIKKDGQFFTVEFSIDLNEN
jgi:two-component system, LytTR family, sensor kinase